MIVREIDLFFLIVVVRDDHRDDYHNDVRVRRNVNFYR